MELYRERQFVMAPNLWVNLQFTHFCRDAGNVAIYALWEPKKNMNPGFRAKKTEIPALAEVLRRTQEVHQGLEFFRLASRTFAPWADMGPPTGNRGAPGATGGPLFSSHMTLQ